MIHLYKSIETIMAGITIVQIPPGHACHSLISARPQQIPQSYKSDPKVKAAKCPVHRDFALQQIVNDCEYEYDQRQQKRIMVAANDIVGIMQMYIQR